MKESCDAVRTSLSVCTDKLKSLGASQNTDAVENIGPEEAKEKVLTIYAKKLLILLNQQLCNNQKVLLLYSYFY